MNAMTYSKTFSGITHLLLIRASIHTGEKIHKGMTEKKPSVGTLSSQCLCEYIQERNTMTIMKSEKLSKGTVFNLTEHMSTSWEESL